LKVPLRVIYDLGDDIDAADLPPIIEALAEASKSKPIGVAYAEEVVNLTRLRIKHGDYPAATLLALDGLTGEWAGQAASNLKKAKPTSSEAAEQITRPHYRAHVEALYDSPLPDWLDSDMLGVLEGATIDLGDDEERRKRILQQLNAAPEPLNFKQVWGIVCQHGQRDEEADEPPFDPEPLDPEPPSPEPKAQETDPAQAAAAEGKRSDIGPLSQAEHERLTATITDLTNQNNRQKTALTGRDNEIARLEADLAKLKGADLPTLTVSKHLDALIALLRKQSREAQEVAIETLCDALKIDPHKLQLSIENEAA
jgi:hypothetical protein